MRTSLAWGPWVQLTRNQRGRMAQLGWVRGHVAVWNRGDGGWQINAYVEGESTRAYVPGVVTWREAERCAARYLQRLMRSAAGVTA